jgi:hypothetical protein
MPSVTASRSIALPAVLVALAALALTALAFATQTAKDDERFLTDRDSSVVLPLPGGEPAFSFAIFGDRTGGPAEGVEVLRQAVADVNLLGPDLVMTVGDLVEGYNTRARWVAQAEEYRSIMAGLGMPWFPVSGNHDIYWRGADRPAEEHEGDYEAHFGPLWYAFEHKGAWFVALHSDEGDPATGLRAFDRAEAQRMSERQFAWLDATLTRIAGARHVFVFLHHPRWLRGGYGDDWERVHARLAAAGNVTAVFAGHIHRMRYDGTRDGIEYFTLATVGGALDHEIPRGGFLHEYHVVTVRNGRIDVVALPVGAALDPRALTGPLSDALADLEQRLPGRVVRRPAVTRDGVAGQLEIELANPSDARLECAFALAGLDEHWLVTPEHFHVVVEPRSNTTVGFGLTRRGSAPFAAAPVLELEAALVTERARFPLPVRSFPLPLDLAEAPAPAPEAVERALLVRSTAGALRVDSAALALPDGPFTIECWLRAEEFRARQGLLAKTESSEFGLFTSEGKASFSVHLDGRYATCETAAPCLEVGRWHHVAGVFDGNELRLYVDGARVAAVAARGRRTPNALPFVVGADVDGSGAATSPFAGLVDEVRVSSVARYTGASFVPARRHTSDDATRLLLAFDGRSPWAYDASPARTHLSLGAGARTVAAP